MTRRMCRMESQPPTVPSGASTGRRQLRVGRGVCGRCVLHRTAMATIPPPDDEHVRAVTTHHDLCACTSPVRAAASVLGVPWLYAGILQDRQYSVAAFDHDCGG